MAISWSHWVFSAHKVDDHDLWVLSNTHFGAGFDFDKQTSGQRQGRQWYARQHNPEAGRYYLEMSSMAEAEKRLGAARLKQRHRSATSTLPRGDALRLRVSSRAGRRGDRRRAESG